MNNTPRLPTISKPRYIVRMDLPNDIGGGVFHSSIFYDIEHLHKIIDEARRGFPGNRFTIIRLVKGRLEQMRCWESQVWLCIDQSDTDRAMRELEKLS